MRVLFCRPTDDQQLSDSFDLECLALEQLGVEPRWIRADWVVDEDASAIASQLEGVSGTLVLRSWMLLEHDYAWLQDAVEECGCRLVNDVGAYANAHYLPNYYNAIAAWTAPSGWTCGTDLDEAWEVAQALGPGALLLKDYVKSAKEHPRLLVLPAAVQRAQFDSICSEFIEYRGDLFEGGLVFRKQLPLAVRGPGVFDEYRQFYWHGEPVVGAPYFDAPASTPDPRWVREVGTVIDSNFFTVDFARLISGEWIVIEVGDGGVSSLPPQLDPRDLYTALLDDLEA